VGERRPFERLKVEGVAKTSSSLLGVRADQVDVPLACISPWLLLPGDVSWSVRGALRGVSNGGAIVAWAAARASSASSLEGQSNESSFATVDVSLLPVGAFVRSIAFSSLSGRALDCGVSGACA
jgi:hypothetical protein